MATQRSEADARLNNAQRKALAAIITRRLDGKIEEARQAEAALEEQITRELFARFKVDALNAEIERLGKQIANLETRRRELGFSERYDHTYEIVGGEAKKLLEMKVRSRSAALLALRERKDVLEQHVWLATTVEEATQLAASLDAEAA